MEFIEHIPYPFKKKDAIFFKKNGNGRITLNFRRGLRKKFCINAGCMFVISYEKENILKWKIKKLDQPNTKAYTVSSRNSIEFTFKSLFNHIKKQSADLDYEIKDDCIYFSFPSD